jgi:hypothetical protein
MQYFTNEPRISFMVLKRPTREIHYTLNSIVNINCQIDLAIELLNNCC